VEEVLDGIAVGDGVVYGVDGAEDVAVYVEEDTGLDGLDEKKSLRGFFNMAGRSRNLMAGSIHRARNPATRPHQLLSPSTLHEDASVHLT
jgi:hypothetical protein